MKRTDGVAEEIRMALEKIPGIRYAFVYNSFASNRKDPEGEVDITVLGGPDLVEMDQVISEAEERLARPFSINSYTVREFQERIKVKDETLLRALKGPKMMLIGDEEMRRL